MTEWLQRFSPPGRAKARLLCLPPGGGSAQLYQRWPALLGPEVEVVAVELPGRGARSLQPPLTDMATLVPVLVAELARLDDLPLVVFGHSMGGIVGWELCRRLPREPRGLVVAAAAAPTRLRSPRWYSETTDEGLRELITRSEGLPSATALDPLFLEYFLPMLRADLTLVNSFEPEPLPPLRCPLRVYRGAADPLVGDDEANAWLAETQGDARVHTFDGGHFFPRDLPEVVLPQLRADVLAAVEVPSL
ncbi:thioesterase II family protein [Nocardia sp. NRRL S-836]|uniref:thioesterase II family protein n=1 Tax=Nocardia sp. NRRL S-836 TaxID=1519492 RepID=UPI0009E6BAD0|nr:alpha/beta fold hydrolase [Nocardia sp. NRRL S-836]